jgi:hypothetical protein
MRKACHFYPVLPLPRRLCAAGPPPPGRAVCDEAGVCALLRLRLRPRGGERAPAGAPQICQSCGVESRRLSDRPRGGEAAVRTSSRHRRLLLRPRGKLPWMSASALGSLCSRGLQGHTSSSQDYDNPLRVNHPADPRRRRVSQAEHEVERGELGRWRSWQFWRRSMRSFSPGSWRRARRPVPVCAAIGGGGMWGAD